jgi:hypothetical protein
MYNLPNFLQPQNRKYFPDYIELQNLAELREKIYQYILMQETNGVSLKKEEKGMYEYKTYPKKYVEAICRECHVLGWKTKIGYGGTVLYVYAEGDKEPDIGNADILEDFE